MLRRAFNTFLIPKYAAQVNDTVVSTIKAEKWDLFAGVFVERLPIITKTLTALEKEYQVSQKINNNFMYKIIALLTYFIALDISRAMEYPAKFVLFCTILSCSSGVSGSQERASLFTASDHRVTRCFPGVSILALCSDQQCNVWLVICLQFVVVSPSTGFN